MTFRFCQSFLLTVALSLFGCSVSLQSSQYALAKNLLKPKSQATAENWEVIWNGSVYPVFAVNHESGIFFANESGLLVNFEGSQVTSLALPGSRNTGGAQIKKTLLEDGTMSIQFYDEGGRFIGNHLCSAWEAVASKNGFKGWDQECLDGSSMYTNQIRANKQSQIVALKQVVVPGVAPIVIEQRF